MAESKPKQETNMPRLGPGGRPGGPGGPMAARMNSEKPKNTKETLFRILKYIGKNKLILIMLVVLMAMITAIDVVGPSLQQKAIDTISFYDGSLHVDLGNLRFYLLIMICIFVCSAAMTFFQGILSAKLSQATVYEMRNDLFKKISRLPIKYTDTHRHGDIMSRMTNDVENVSNAIAQSITSLFSALLTLVGVTAMMLYYSWIMTIVAIVTIPITVFISSKLAKFMRKYFVRQQKLLGQINGHVEEMISSYKTVVAYSKEEEAIEKFGQVSDDLRKCSISARVWGSIMGPIMNFLGNFQYVILASLGGFMMIKGYGGMTIGKIQAMLQYSKNFSRPINMIAAQYSSILTALAGAERIFEIMDRQAFRQLKFHIKNRGDRAFYVPERRIWKRNGEFQFISLPLLSPFNIGNRKDNGRTTTEDRATDNAHESGGGALGRCLRAGTAAGRTLRGGRAGRPDDREGRLFAGERNPEARMLLRPSPPADIRIHPHAQPATEARGHPHRHGTSEQHGQSG